MAQPATALFDIFRILGEVRVLRFSADMRVLQPLVLALLACASLAVAMGTQVRCTGSSNGAPTTRLDC